jgi:hypothetical protein
MMIRPWRLGPGRLVGRPRSGGALSVLGIYLSDTWSVSQPPGPLSKTLVTVPCHYLAGLEIAAKTNHPTVRKITHLFDAHLLPRKSLPALTEFELREDESPNSHQLPKIRTHNALAGFHANSAGVSVSWSKRHLEVRILPTQPASRRLAPVSRRDAAIPSIVLLTGNSAVMTIVVSGAADRHALFDFPCQLRYHHFILGALRGLAASCLNGEA